MRPSFNYPGRTGRMRIGPGMITPFIKWMLIINAGVFILQFVFRGQLEPTLGLTPAPFFADFPNKLYQVFTYMFLHSTHSFFHLLFNMFVLWMFGTEIESAWGPRTFGRFYLIAGLCGAILTLIIYPSQPQPVIGASGAIYGVMAAYWVMFPNRMLYLWMLVPVKVKWAIPAFLLIGFFMGGNVAHMAHVGGFVAGLVMVKADWRWARFSKKVKGLKSRRLEKKLEKNRENASAMMHMVDEILDKINAQGIESLSKSERKFLEDASSHLSSKERREER